MVYIIPLISEDSNIYQIYSLNSNFCLYAVSSAWTVVFGTRIKA